jgi:hypothetical protein
MSELAVPESLCCDNATCENQLHSDQRDKHVIDILCTIIETSQQCIPLFSRQGPGKEASAGSQPLPGWKRQVAPLKNDSPFWHSVWLSAERPNKGALHQVMCHACSKYHRAVSQPKGRLALSEPGT